MGGVCSRGWFYIHRKRRTQAQVFPSLGEDAEDVHSAIAGALPVPGPTTLVLSCGGTTSPHCSSQLVCRKIHVLLSDAQLDHIFQPSLPFGGAM